MGLTLWKNGHLMKILLAVFLHFIHKSENLSKRSKEAVIYRNVRSVILTFPRYTLQVKRVQINNVSSQSMYVCIYFEVLYKSVTMEGPRCPASPV